MSKIGGLASRCVEIKLRAKVRAGANQSSQIISMCIDDNMFMHVWVLLILLIFLLRDLWPIDSLLRPDRLMSCLHSLRPMPNAIYLFNELPRGGVTFPVFKLVKNLRRTNKAGRLVWNEHLVDGLVGKLKFKQSKVDECIFYF